MDHGLGDVTSCIDCAVSCGSDVRNIFIVFVAARRVRILKDRVENVGCKEKVDESNHKGQGLDGYGERYLLS